MSENLSKTIIAEAIKQVQQISGISRLLVMLADQRQAELEIVCCRRRPRANSDSDSSFCAPSSIASSTTPKRAQLSTTSGPKSADKQGRPDDDSCCPLCNGNGALDLSGEDVIRLKLAQTNGNNNEQHIAANSAGSPVSGVASNAAAGLLSASKKGQLLLNGARGRLANRLVEWLDANVAPLRALEQTETVQSAAQESSTQTSRLPCEPSALGPRSGISGGQDLLPAERVAPPEDVSLDQVRRNYGHRRRQSIEQLLVKLRDEQRALAEQAEALRVAECKLEQQAAANRRHPSTQNRPDAAQPHKRSPASAGPCRPVQQATTGGRELSSSIQRMKRMDTLKRRKLEKEKRLGQEAGGQPLNRLAAETANLGSIRFAKPLTESIMSGLTTASDASIAEAEEAEVDDDDDGYQEVLMGTVEGGRKPGRLGRRPGSLDQGAGRFGDGDTTDDDGDPCCPAGSARRKAEREAECAGRPAPSGGQTARLRKVVAGETRETGETGGAPPDPAAKARASGQPDNEGTAARRTSSAYSYQGLRSSLASLVDEVSEQSRKRKFANLNPFANKSIVAAFSSLGSPIKRASQKNNTPPSPRKSPKEMNVQTTTTRTSGNGERQQNPSATVTTHKTEPRKHSSRSQSSGSAGATPSSPRPAGNRIALGSNCPNCLKSSASSQSVNSLNDEHHQPESLK